MDDAREWTATAPRAGEHAPAAVQPGDPWGTPVWTPYRRAVDEPEAVDLAPAGLRRRGIALAIDLVIAVILWTIGTQLAVSFAKNCSIPSCPW